MINKLYISKLNYLKHILHLVNPNILTSFKNVIHITGTNGKGSTTAFLRKILEEHNFSVNVFTSPHLINETERIRIKSQHISQDYLTNLKNIVQEKINYIENQNNNPNNKIELGFFYLYTLYALIAFYQNPADFTILEVGIGGRYDATNILPNTLISIFTNIGLDHTNFLGNTKSKIALEKSFIIKKNSIVISSYQSKKVMDVLINQAINLQAQKFIQPNKKYFIKNNILSYNNQKVSMIEKSLQGKYQNNNSALAIIAALSLNNKFNNVFNINKIKKAINSAKWEGRNQIFTSLYNHSTLEPYKIILDGAHNKSGIQSFLQYAEKELKFDSENTIIIFGMLAKKNIQEASNLLIKSKFKTIYTVTINSTESLSSKEIANNLLSTCKILKQDKTIKNFTNIAEAFKFLHQKNINTKNILIFGSLYLVGQVLQENNIKIT